MTHSDPPVIRCVGAVVRDVSGLLLLVRRANDPGRGRWSLPGGRVEPGESDAEALVREVYEETRLSVAVGPLLGSVLRPAPRGVFEIHDYGCQVISGVLRAGDDASAAEWFDHAMFTTLRRDGVLTDGLAEALEGWDVLPAG
jgi:8-oxo-dGTP diphosphatase